MKKISLIFLASAAMFFVGCANKQPLPQKEQMILANKQSEHLKSKEKKEIKKEIISNKQKKYSNLNSTKQLEKQLIKSNVLYAEDDIKDSLNQNLRAKDTPPLYKNPYFAKMVVMPYVSKDKNYHQSEEIWIKIKDGEFILDQNKGVK